MKRLACLGIGLLLLFPSLLSLTRLRESAPPPERIGYRPSFEVTYFTSLEFRYLLSELLFYDAVFYYGSMLERPKERPDYVMLGRYIDSATRLNAYNIDAYYFGQAIITWEGGMVRDMNVILERGAKRRNWDYYLPFFLGFNNAYFLNDRETAAKYYAQAARLNPRQSFLPNLVGRLYYEANKTDQAIEYLKIVARGTFNDAVRRSLETRIATLEAIRFLEGAVRRYERKNGRLPADISDLVSGGVLKAIPPDPYGGHFYYDRGDGRIKTTSKMAFQEPRK